MVGCNRPSSRCKFGRNLTRLDCSGGLRASQVLHSQFLSASRGPTNRFPSLLLPSRCLPKRNIYRDGARAYQQSRRFLGFVVPAVLKPARTLWHELLGFVFMLMATAFVFSGLRAIHQFDGTPSAILRLVIIALGIGILGGYGISSFLRARKISRS